MRVSCRAKLGRKKSTGANRNGWTQLLRSPLKEASSLCPEENENMSFSSFTRAVSHAFKSWLKTSAFCKMALFNPHGS